MPAPAHVHLEFSGVLGTVAGGVETWSMGLNANEGTLIAASDATVLAALQTVADAAEVEFAQRLSQIVSPAVRLTRTRAVRIGDNGKYRRAASGAFQLADSTSDFPGTGANSFHPFQVALAVSTRSVFDGPTGRGRFYVPMPSANVDGGSGLIEETVQTTMKTNLDIFLTNINTILNSAWTGRLVIASGGSATKGLAPALHPIVEVGVGRVLDTMRSRRADLNEQISWSAL